MIINSLKIKAFVIWLCGVNGLLILAAVPGRHHSTGVRGSIFVHLICRSVIHANSSIQFKKMLSKYTLNYCYISKLFRIYSVRLAMSASLRKPIALIRGYGTCSSSRSISHFWSWLSRCGWGSASSVNKFWRMV